MGPRARMDAARRQVVRRAARSTRASTASTGTSGRRGATRPRSSGRASRATAAPSPTSTSTARSARSPTCCKLARRAARRPRRALPAADSRAGHGDARLRPHRRGAQRGVRRLQRRVAARPHQRRAGRSCSSRPTAATAAAASCRSSRRPTRRCRRRRPSSHVVVVRGAARGDAGAEMQEGRDHWYHRADGDGEPRLPARGDGRRGHALHPLHLGHHRKAQGHRPHDGRLHGRRPTPRRSGCSTCKRGRRLLVHGRHRLGDRAQLPRLRSARQRRHGGDVRRRARLAREGPLLGDRRAVRRDDPLHRAHRDPRVHAVGDRVAGASTTCRSLRLLGSVGEPINPEAWMWYHKHIGGDAVPDRRYLVADRDGHDHDHAAARRHQPQAGLGHASVPGDRRRDPEPGRRPHRRGRRPARDHAPLALHAARHLRRPRALPAAVPGAGGATAPTSRATAPSATKTATSGCWAASTTC